MKKMLALLLALVMVLSLAACASSQPAAASTETAETTETTEPAAGTYEEIIDRLRGSKVTLVGDGVERFLNKPSGLSLHAIKMLNCPPIEDLAACGLQKYQNKIFDFPKPLYLRAPDVCIK